MSTITYCGTCHKVKYVSWMECGGETLVETPREWCACVSLNLISSPYGDGTVYYPLSPASLEQIRQIVREELERFSKKWTEG